MPVCGRKMPGWAGKKGPSKGKKSPLWIENSSPFRGVEKIPGMGSRICPQWVSKIKWPTRVGKVSFVGRDETFKVWKYNC